MTSEREWAESLKRDLIAGMGTGNLVIETGRRLPYTLHAHGYAPKGKSSCAIDHDSDESQSYETDLLISESLSRPSILVPRVIVECKFGRISAHDSITYAAKAVAHRQVWPFVRYGFILGRYDSGLPNRLLWHGADFDFMLVVAGKRVSETDRSRLVRLLHQEIRASKDLQSLLRDKRKGRRGTRLVHRRLVVQALAP